MDFSTVYEKLDETCFFVLYMRNRLFFKTPECLKYCIILFNSIANKQLISVDNVAEYEKVIEWYKMIHTYQEKEAEYETFRALCLEGKGEIIKRYLDELESAIKYTNKNYFG